MASDKNGLRTGRSISMAVSAIAYLLPFLTVGCPAGDRTASGINLVTGVTVTEEQFFGPPTQRRQDGEPVAMLAFGLAIAAAVVGLGKTNASRMGCAAASALSGLFLLILRQGTEQEVQSQGMGMLSVQWEIGYWIALLGCGAGVVIALMSPSETIAPDVLERSPSLTTG
jgi:hypothetical protein